MNQQKIYGIILLLLILVSACSRLDNNKDISKNLKCINCNVILIGIDALRADHMSAYGYFRETTPNLDNFANESFIFKKTISTSSWTLPSFMSMFTSVYPSEHKIKNIYARDKEGKSSVVNIKEINPNIKTLAELLKQNGYRNAAFTGGGGVHKRFGFDKGFDIYYDPSNFTGFESTIPEALKWLDENKNERFFLFLHGYDIHGRYLTEKNYSGIFIDKNYKGHYTGYKDEQIKIRNQSLEEGYVDLSDEDKEFWISLYDSKLYDADQRIGKFLSRIEDFGLLNNSIIIILSDHGEELFERNRTDHGFSLYDELIHVPLIIYIPHLRQRIDIQQQVRTIDIMPTILNIVDVNLDGNIKAQMKGISLVPLMKGEKINLDAFSETDYLYKVFKRSIRKANGWKFIYSLDTNERELYNLKEDPGEKRNLINEEPRIAYELEQELFKQMYG